LRVEGPGVLPHGHALPRADVETTDGAYSPVSGT